MTFDASNLLEALAAKLSRIEADQPIDQTEAPAIPQHITRVAYFRDISPGQWAKTLAFLEIDPAGEFRELGRGSRGVAYDCGDKVLKLTTDRKEAQAASIIAKAPDEAGNIARYHKACQLNLTNGGRIYALTMEKLQKADGSWATFGAIWREWTRQNHYAPILPSIVEVFFQWCEALPKRIKSKLLFDEQEWVSFKPWLRECAGYLARVGIAFHDLKAENLMRRGAQHVLIDFGHSRMRTNPSLKRIQAALASEIVEVSSPEQLLQILEQLFTQIEQPAQPPNHRSNPASIVKRPVKSGKRLPRRHIL